VSDSDTEDVLTPSCNLVPSGSSSSCTATITPLHVNTNPHTISAIYSTDAFHLASNNSAPMTVNLANTTTTLTSSVNPSVFGQTVTFKAIVQFVPPADGKATGTVTFYDGGVAIGTGTLGKGGTTFTTSSLAVGNHNITTSYDGDDQSTGST